MCPGLCRIVGIVIIMVWELKINPNDAKFWWHRGYSANQYNVSPGCSVDWRVDGRFAESKGMAWKMDWQFSRLSFVPQIEFVAVLYDSKQTPKIMISNKPSAFLQRDTTKIPAPHTFTAIWILDAE